MALCIKEERLFVVELEGEIANEQAWLAESLGGLIGVRGDKSIVAFGHWDTACDFIAGQGQSKTPELLASDYGGAIGPIGPQCDEGPPSPNRESLVQNPQAYEPAATPKLDEFEASINIAPETLPETDEMTDDELEAATRPESDDTLLGNG